MRIFTATLFTALMVLSSSFQAHAAGKHNHTAPIERQNSPTVNVTSPRTIKPGTPQALTLRLTDASGTPITVDKLTEVHTKKLHLFVVAPDFSEYLHVHPEAAKKTGEYTVMVKPEQSGYVVWADITLENGGHLPVRTTWGSPAAQPVISKTAQLTAEAAGIAAAIQDSVLTAGGDSTLQVKLHDASGKPVTNLEEFLGASAHLVGFDGAQTRLLHAHPMDGVKTPGMLQFHVNPPIAGVWKVFLQVQRAGAVLTFPFTLLVKAE
ncbi:MAG: hypothetical protein ACK5XX_07310 [Holosporales bacterium]|jgi:hypothetical protein